MTWIYQQIVRAKLFEFIGYGCIPTHFVVKDTVVEKRGGAAEVEGGAPKLVRPLESGPDPECLDTFF